MRSDPGSGVLLGVHRRDHRARFETDWSRAMVCRRFIADLSRNRAVLSQRRRSLRLILRVSWFIRDIASGRTSQHRILPLPWLNSAMDDDAQCES